MNQSVHEDKTEDQDDGTTNHAGNKYACLNVCLLLEHGVE